MIHEALKYLVELGREEQVVVQDAAAPGAPLYTRALYGPPDFRPDAISVLSLTGLAAYVAENPHGLALGDAAVVVESHRRVSVCGRPDEYGRRTTYVEAECDTPSLDLDATWTTPEQAKVLLASRCAPGGDRDAVVKLLGTIVGTEVRDIEDDGISQSVTTRKSVAAMGRTDAPREVQLAPYSTFFEVPQPMRLFLLRLRGTGAPDEPILARLFEADGGAWRAAARRSIAEWLRKALSGVAVIG